MTIDSYKYKNIVLGSPSKAGHVYYPYASYIPDGNKIVFKENKHGVPLRSCYEVAFSNVASLYLNANPFEKLVVNDDNEIMGLAVEHISYVIHKRENANKSFYKFKTPKKNLEYEAQNCVQLTDIPYYFLDQLPPEAFADLLELERNGKIGIDYESLANILTSSYTLEEDDLHKGNFGLYLVERADGKPTAVFFKIDHDLMFADSIISYTSPRLPHWILNNTSFRIKSQDLIDFPDLGQSANFYWPTKRSFLPFVLSYKKFVTDRELASFANLKHHPEFIRAKWMNFYKHILIPTELVYQSLYSFYSHDKPNDQRQVTLITQSLVARQAELRAVLLSTPEFRDFLIALSDKDKAALVSEIAPEDKVLQAKVQNQMNLYHTFSTVAGFEEGDTPLHTAIKLGDYRFEDTIDAFGEFINTKNAAGKTPFDIAYEKSLKPSKESDDLRQNARLTMKSLLDNGADYGDHFKTYKELNQVMNQKFDVSYVNNACSITDYRELRGILTCIGEDPRYCLKTKKNIAIECVSTFIRAHKNNLHLEDMLMQLQNDLQGCAQGESCHDLKYIRQLRSKLWIVRQFRGLYGESSTYTTLRDMIQTELARLQEKSVFSVRFFPQSPPTQEPEGPCSEPESKV